MEAERWVSDGEYFKTSKMEMGEKNIGTGSWSKVVVDIGSGHQEFEKQKS